MCWTLLYERMRRATYTTLVTFRNILLICGQLAGSSPELPLDDFVESVREMSYKHSNESIQNDIDNDEQRDIARLFLSILDSIELKTSLDTAWSAIYKLSLCARFLHLDPKKLLEFDLPSCSYSLLSDLQSVGLWPDKSLVDMPAEMTFNLSTTQTQDLCGFVTDTYGMWEPAENSYFHDTQALVIWCAIGSHSGDLDLSKWVGIRRSTFTAFRGVLYRNAKLAQLPGQLVFATLAILSCHRTLPSENTTPTQSDVGLCAEAEPVLMAFSKLLEGEVLADPERILSSVAKSLVVNSELELARYFGAILQELGVASFAPDEAVERYCQLRLCAGLNHSDALIQAKGTELTYIRQ
ncbi:hypothetical protein CCUS01_06557 [Colletotrichum cuscutae]|uniref:Uncharacterized protein n=1 Tax=Colletotrichum cuscutae TaxID=1209917 RepID=A0AAI9V638_9PEZI|nr:hypothetical protein CCUS01_06557 [Colletotrichum cuscutae]